MAYEEEKDVGTSDATQLGDSPFHVQLRVYDGGEEKVCVYRVVGKKDRKLMVFRLSPSETAELIHELAKVGYGKEK